MKTILINGTSLGNVNRVTGIQRVCRELICELDLLLEQETDILVKYLYFEEDLNVIINPENFKNIIPVPLRKVSKTKTRFLFSKIIKKENGILCNLSLETVFCSKQISFIHDVRPIVEKFDTLKFRIKYRIYLALQKMLCGYYFTVSDYQKELIKKHLKIKENKISTIYNGWEHIKEIKEDYSIFDKFPELKKKGFYYSLGSIAPHKNFIWVLEVAKRNPEKLFVIAGSKDLVICKDNFKPNELSNVIFLGYVSDEENKALLTNCKAFLHPSKHEGFGIPPLEALACGAEIIISNATCLPEIYEDCAHYFDPDDYEVNLDKIIAEPVADPKKILEKCSWEKSAKELLNVLKQTAME